MLVQDQFDIEFQKTCLVGCNVIIKSGGFSSSFLLDKTNIKSFSMKRGNNGVWDSVPYEFTVVEIMGWKNLTAQQKNSLKTVGNVLQIYFSVNGYQTTSGVYHVIEELKVDSNDDNFATLKCAGLFKYSSMLRRVYVTDRLGSAFGKPYQTYPMDVSRTEENQHLCLSNGRGLKATGIVLFDVSTSTIDLNNCTCSMYYLKKNIIGNVQRYADTPNKTDVVAVGVDTDVDTVTLIDREVDPNSLGQYFLPYEQQSLLEDYQGKALINGTWQDLVKGTNLGGWKCVGGFDFNTANYVFPVAPTKLRFIALGKKVRNIVDNNSIKNILCRMHLDTETGSLEFAQTKIRRYYSFNTYCEFDCRIDPRIEPQDCIYVEGVGMIRVEETQLKFSGGFKGHIKGRLIQPYNEPLKAPVITTFEYSANNYYLVIDNPTPFNVTLHISYEGGEITETLRPYYNRGFTQTSNPELVPSVNAYIAGTLQESVYCYFAHDDGQIEDSNNVIIMQANA